MDQLLATITASLASGITGVAGPAVARPLVGPITGVDLVIVAVYLALALGLHFAAVFILRRRHSTSIDRGPSSWRRRAYQALARPLYIMIWVYGAYLAITPILLRLGPSPGIASLHRAMDLASSLGAFLALFWFLFRATRVLEEHVAAWSAARPGKIDDLLVPLMGVASRVLVVVAAIMIGLPMLGLRAEYASAFSKLTSIVLIGSVAVLLLRGVNIAQSVVLRHFDISATDNLRARQVYTQVHVIGRVVDVTIGVFAVAAVLMLFQEVRHVGTSLLASAGILGVIGGLAAQKTLSNVFAGFQIALAQPIRQDDVLVVEGEWGRVEEITLTYVVVHIWDERRLILPLSYFIEKPFQNWTRTSAAITGTVFLWVDYAFPVEAARAALKEIVESSPLWDRRFWNLQVSDMNERALQLRVLATSGDSSKSWDLRCEIREKFMGFIREHHPHCLPTLRAEVSSSSGAR
jgi:small-conductance mechanosensitive channel